MFKFSFNAMEEQAKELLDELKNDFIIEYSYPLEKLFEEHNIESYEYLGKVAELSSVEKQDDEPIFDIVVLSYNHSPARAKLDLSGAIGRLGGTPNTRTIPYISLSLPDDYQNPHWQHIYLFFVTPFNDLFKSEKHMIYYFNKYHDLEAFS